MINLSIQNFYDLSCNVYVRDLDGTILDCNDFQAQSAGFSRASDLIGSNDRDLLDEETFLMVRKNDLAIRDARIPKTFVETVVVNNQTLTFSCNKIPLFNKRKKIIGIFGTAVKVENGLARLDTQLDTPTLQDSIDELDNLVINNITVSKRERECIHYLMQGLSAKGIARKLNLSSRTIEFYINRMKEKYNCKNKIELITKVLSQR